MARTKIVATLGPASRPPRMLRAMLDAGVSVVRINCSHGTRDDLAAQVRLVRQIAEEAGRQVAVLVDLQGPKIRVGTLEPAGIPLDAGQPIVLRGGVETAELGVIPVPYAKFATDMRPGDRVLLHDGLLEVRVLAVEGSDVSGEVIRGGVVHSRKGVNMPGAAVSAASPTLKDLEDLTAVAAEGIDYVALSFVRSAGDLRRLRDALTSLRSTASIVAKLERPEAIECLDEILDETDAVMIARGDLGVETGPEIVPVLQKRIISNANAHAIPVITATEMLESMVTESRPSRAEASDVANAVFDGTSAVMLSAETAVGADPARAVRYMARICECAEQAPEFAVPSPAPHGIMTPARAVARAVVQAVRDLGAVAVVVHTQSGSSSRLVASFRPGVPVLALSPVEATLRQLPLHYGVQGEYVPPADDSLSLMAQANDVALRTGLARDGDTVIVVAGAPGQIGGTNRLLVHRVDASLPPYEPHPTETDHA